MTDDNPSERALFADLTRLFMSMREATHAQLEAMIEQRFREFVRAHPGHDAAGLKITLTWSLPDGADDWAIYGAEYETIPAAAVVPQSSRAVANGSGAIVDFPGTRTCRSATTTGCTARVIAFQRP
jgi:hypothetical protein